MVSHSDISMLTAAQRQIVDLALRDIRELIGWVDLSSPERARDVFLEIIPTLTQEYGDLAATAAAEWYEELRPGAFQATTVAPVAREAVEGTVRAKATHLFTENPLDFVSVIEGAVQRHIVYSGRATIARNVRFDPLKPRYGRVPLGGKTCAWCMMLSSRGFVYRTPETAGLIEGSYHDGCSCEIVPSWESNEAHIRGYDPERSYAMYLAAREASGATDDASIAAKMREMFPDDVTDGHAH